MHARSRVREEPRAKSFDVICAGEALWKIRAPGSDLSRGSRGVGLRAGGGPLNVAMALAGAGLRVGVATVVTDDTFGRGYVRKIAATGVDTGGVALAQPRAGNTGLVRVDASGGAHPIAKDAEAEPPLEVPAGWSSRVLLLSGLSPVISHAAALCKAARAARRQGTFVLLDFNASLHVWAGRDPRTILMVLREVDAARCSLADLAVLGLDATTVRGTLRSDAVLVVSDGVGGAVATGPFGDVSVVPPPGALVPAPGHGDACTAAICAELARPPERGESPRARWFRALRTPLAASVLPGAF
jgi:2-dehydro-3-deoxygluconokinase